MALAVRHAQRVHGETLLACDGEDDGGIHATGDEDDGFFHGNRKSGIVKRYRPGSSSHSSLCSCIWNLPGRRSAPLQSASSRGASPALLGEHSTTDRKSAV